MSWKFSTDNDSTDSGILEIDDAKIDKFRHGMAWNVMVGYSKINQNIYFVCLINQYSGGY